jgi:hypothetical protein
VAKGFVTGDSPGRNFEWPEGAGPCSESPHFDLSRYSDSTHADLVNSFLVDTRREWAFFTALQRKFGLLFGYVYQRADFPWLNVWECNTEKMQTRGMEFSNTPHHGTMKTLIRASEIWGAPTYEWLDAHSTIRKSFLAFLHPIPQSYAGIGDIRVRPQALEIVERHTGHVIEVPI